LLGMMSKVAPMLQGRKSQSWGNRRVSRCSRAPRRPTDDGPGKLKRRESLQSRFSTWEPVPARPLPAKHGCEAGFPPGSACEPRAESQQRRRSQGDPALQAMASKLARLMIGLSAANNSGTCCTSSRIACRSSRATDLKSLETQ
jgi:hypothetical protein